MPIHPHHRAEGLEPKRDARRTRASAGPRYPGNGNGSWDSVQAPLTLITAFLRLARSSTFGRSAQGCGGAGGGRGCRVARWWVIKRVSGGAAINAPPPPPLPPPTPFSPQTPLSPPPPNPSQP